MSAKVNKASVKSLSKQSDLQSVDERIAALPSEAERVAIVELQDNYAKANRLPEHTPDELQTKADAYAKLADYKDAAELATKYAAKAAEANSLLKRHKAAVQDEDELRALTAAKTKARKQRNRIILIVIVAAALIAYGIYILLQNMAADDVKSTGSEVPTASQMSQLAVGDNLQFGSFDGKLLQWRVLDIQPASDGLPKRALLITQDAITLEPFDSEYVHMRWEESSIRRWLNATFYDTFTDEQKLRMLNSLIYTLLEPGMDYSKSGVRELTQDNIWLLSPDEAERYFADATDRIAYYTEPDRDAVPIIWWLRLYGTDRTNHYASAVSNIGTINTANGSVTTSKRGVRPALWLSLESGD